MDTLQDQVQDPLLLRLEADLTARVDALFRRFPILCGFSVQEGSRLTRERAADHLGGDLFLADLACYATLDDDQSAALCEEISHTILELVEERPEAVELLPGRTFARTMH
jgi:hypothetical protein